MWPSRRAAFRRSGKRSRANTEILARIAGPDGLRLEMLEPRLYRSADSVLDWHLQLGNEHGSGCCCGVCSGTEPHLDILKFTFDEAADGAPEETPSVGELTIGPTGVPLLHSNLGAAATVFLDFDGHFESNWGSFNDITTPAYDIDGQSGTFSNTEQARIENIWTRIAEDFAPLDIDVTTEASDSFANGESLRVAIGGSSFDWLGVGAGGVAYLGSFTNSIVNTVYVFTDQLGNGQPKYVAEAASHEAGHGFGLSHQSLWIDNTKVSEYHPGNNGWAPIMGAGYYESVTTWHNGQSSSGFPQDDLSILTNSINGFGYRNDDHGNSQGTGSPLDIFGESVSAAGVIERNNDVDVFVFNTGSGQIDLDVDVIDVGANLDVVLDLYDSTGTLVQSANPGSSLGAGITANVGAGTYGLHVRNAGDYGSLGQYSISGTIVPGADPGDNDDGGDSQDPLGPEVTVTYSAYQIDDDSSVPVDFGTAQRGSLRPTLSFYVRNDGDESLALGSLLLPDGFTLVQDLSPLLAPGEADKFSVALDTDTEGTWSGEISFTTSDADESLFNFAVTGEVGSPPDTVLMFGGRLKAKYLDADGDQVTVMLRGPGEGKVVLPGEGYSDALQIQVSGTTERSSLKIVTRGASSFTTIGDITVDGSLSSLQARKVELGGDLTVSGGLRSIRLGDVNNAAQQTISIGSTEAYRDRSLSMMLGRVAEVSIDSEMAISNVKVADWVDQAAADDQILAPSIKNLRVRGNFGADLKLTDASAEWTLGNLRVAGWLDNAHISTAGNILGVTVGGMRDSTLMAGVGADDAGLPSNAGDFDLFAVINRLSVRGIKNNSELMFQNSNVAAWTIKQVKIASVEQNNGGTLFGLATHQFKRVSYSDENGAKSVKQNRNPQSVNALGDFVIRVI